MAGFGGRATVSSRTGIESHCCKRGHARKKRLTGERLAWFRVASHLQIPVGELRQRIGYSEFLEWLDFLQIEDSRVTKADLYLAQIAAEVRRSSVTEPRKVKIADFLVRVPENPTAAKAEPEDAKARAQRSKKAWLDALAVKAPVN